MIAFLVYLIAKELGLSKGGAFISGVLFLSSASAYQVVLWSIVGNNYFVSCFFYLLALLLFLQSLNSGRKPPAWSSAVFFTLALFSHEQSVSLFPLCCVAVLLFDRSDVVEENNLTVFLRFLRRSLRQLGPLFIPLFVFLSTKYWMSFHTSVLLGTPHYDKLVEGVTKGTVRCLSLRSDGVLFNEINHLIRSLIGFPAWGCIFFLILSLAFLRLSTRGRFLLLWITGHLIMMQIAVGIAARHVYLPTAAASILVVEILSQWIFRQSGNTARSRLRLFPALLSLIFLATLLYYSIHDLSLAQKSWIRTDRMIRGLESRVIFLAKANQNVRKLVILNATAKFPNPFCEIFSFKNGLGELVDLATPGRFESVVLAHTPGHDNNANGSFLMPMSQLARLLTDRTTAAVRLDRAGGKFSRVPLSSLRKQGLLKVHNPWVEMANPATRPELDWLKHRKRPKVVIFPQQEIETYLTPPQKLRPWFLVTWKKEADLRYEIRVGKTWHRIFSTSVSTGWDSSLELLPSLQNEPSKIPISIRNQGAVPLRLSVFGFLRPKRLVNAQTSPEFTWDHENMMEIQPRCTFSLPLPTPGPNPCVEIISSSDENRRIELLSETSQEIELNYPTSTDGPWMTLTADLPLDTHSISIRAIGSQPAKILQIWFPRPEDLQKRTIERGQNSSQNHPEKPP